MRHAVVELVATINDSWVLFANITFMNEIVYLIEYTLEIVLCEGPLKICAVHT